MAEVAEGDLAHVKPKVGDEFSCGGHSVPEVLFLVANKKPILVDRNHLTTNVDLVSQPCLLELEAFKHDFG